MNKKIRITLMAVLCIPSVVHAQTDSIYSLKRCIETAVENNLLLRTKGQEVEKGRITIDENRARLLPQIQAFGNFMDYADKPTSVSISSQLGSSPAEGQSYMQTRGMKYQASGGLQLNMPVYNQTLYTAINIARQMKEISRIEYDKAVEDLTVQVAQLFYQAQTTQEETELCHENIRRLSELRDITAAMYDNGMALDIDLQRVDINLENTTVQYNNSLSLYQQQLNLLRYVMGLAPETPVCIEPYKETKPDTSILSKGLSSDLYEIQLLEAKSTLLEQQGKKIRQGYLPTFSFVGQLGYTKYADHFSRMFNSKDTPEWFNSCYWGFTMSIPIFDGLDKRIKLKKNKVEISQNRLMLEDTRNSLRTEYENAVNDYMNNRRNYVKQRDNYLLAENVYGIAAEKYKEGVTSMTELLQDEISMSNAQTNYVNAHYNYKVSELQLLRLGRQLDSLTSK